MHINLRFAHSAGSSFPLHTSVVVDVMEEVVAVVVVAVEVVEGVAVVVVVVAVVVEAVVVLVVIVVFVVEVEVVVDSSQPFCVSPTDVHPPSLYQQGSLFAIGEPLNMASDFAATEASNCQQSKS